MKIYLRIVREFQKSPEVDLKMYIKKVVYKEIGWKNYW